MMLMWATISSLDESSPQINKAVFRRVANKLNKFSRHPSSSKLCISSVAVDVMANPLGISSLFKVLQTSKSFVDVESTFYDILEILPALSKVMLEIKTSCGTIDINRIFTTKRAARGMLCNRSGNGGKSSWENSSILNFVLSHFIIRRVPFIKLIKLDFAVLSVLSFRYLR